MTDGTATWSYTYDANGMRTQRSNGTTTYNYVYNGSQLSQMTVDSNTLNFAYDAGGVPVTVNYNGTNYYYITNLQGDVTGIANSSGAVVVSYTYDAWGKPLSITGSMAATLGTLNPLRYRGYIYDTETGLYYLESRYYDPEIGRFINADTFVATGQGMLGNNMFAYCGNNPVNRYDPTGNRYCQVSVKQAGDSSGSPRIVQSNAPTISAEEIVRQELQTNGYSRYKEALVVKVDFMGSSAASFGVIFMGTEILYDEEFPDLLNHEYGHYIHFQQIGPTNYFWTTAVPSLIGAGLSYVSPTVRDNYYSLPWERVADYLGGVNHEYLPYADTAGSLFWLFTLLV